MISGLFVNNLIIINPVNNFLTLVNLFLGFVTQKWCLPAHTLHILQKFFFNSETHHENKVP